MIIDDRKCTCTMSGELFYTCYRCRQLRKREKIVKKLKKLYKQYMDTFK